MKKNILLSILVLCLSGCQKDNDKLLAGGYEITPVGSTECSNETLYYMDDERTVYLACYENINLTKDNKSISLNEYLVDNSLDSFISKLDKETKSTTLKDGGTNDIDNIYPEPWIIHQQRHVQRGDFKRWLKERKTK